MSVRTTLRFRFRRSLGIIGIPAGRPRSRTRGADAVLRNGLDPAGSLSAGGFPAETKASPTTFSANLAGGGSAIVRLSCGADSVTARLVAPGGDVTLPQSTAQDCSVELTSQDSGFYLKQAAIARAIGNLDLHGVRWIAAGTYRVEPVERGGSAAGGMLFIDRRAAGSLVRVARDGFHDVRWCTRRRMPSVRSSQRHGRRTPAIGVKQDSSQRWSFVCG